ncbi:hypothetical protein CCHL11_10108 [Colletotrichum chlorophyti]|uniref:C2H2-type domain-containing protein n=1 Tax=Colletotrichum chlorophyti TaxID=708187 RepID=A0A1Q8RTG8_9PEZI|nr:hypothetical protein CCHL11_10108 [Colletotrichum chlorophyti]
MEKFQEDPRDQSNLDQTIFDSLLGLGPSQNGSITDQRNDLSLDPDTIYSTSTDNGWTPNLAVDSQYHFLDRTDEPVFSAGDFEHTAPEFDGFQWPLPTAAVGTETGIAWSSIRDDASIDRAESTVRRGLPRRRSRYRFYNAHDGTRPVMIPVSSSIEGLDPMQRWRESPPQDEPASIAAICGALRGRSVSLEPEEHHISPTYAQTNSGTSLNSAGSSSSLHSGTSAWSAGSDGPPKRNASSLQRSRRSRGTKKYSDPATKDVRPFKCTFCCDSFKTKYDWARHEKSRHVNLESWVCTPQGGSVISTVTGRFHCAYCSAVDPTDKHLDGHNHNSCHDRPIEARSFARKDHLVQHLRVMHNLERLPNFEGWKMETTEVSSRCGFCNLTLSSWKGRVDHLANHFRKGVTMKDWKGEHGFNPAISQQISHALPPYLIGAESLSPMPFSATSQNTKDHFAQISSRTKGSPEATATLGADTNVIGTLETAGILNSRAATSKAFTEVLEQHLKHFADEHVSRGICPTDEMLRKESRRVIYDCDDEWNQTVADNSEWLTTFRARYGIGDVGAADTCNDT